MYTYTIVSPLKYIPQNNSTSNTNNVVDIIIFESKIQHKLILLDMTPYFCYFIFFCKATTRLTFRNVLSTQWISRD